VRIYGPHAHARLAERPPQRGSGRGGRRGERVQRRAASGGAAEPCAWGRCRTQAHLAAHDALRSIRRVDGLRLAQRSLRHRAARHKSRRRRRSPRCRGCGGGPPCNSISRGFQQGGGRYDSNWRFERLLETQQGFNTVFNRWLPRACSQLSSARARHPAACRQAPRCCTPSPPSSVAVRSVASSFSSPSRSWRWCVVYISPDARDCLPLATPSFMVRLPPTVRPVACSPRGAARRRPVVGWRWRTHAYTRICTLHPEMDRGCTSLHSPCRLRRAASTLVA
jgi:hypothetical protein